jgi:hypothetical protein
MVQVSSFRRSLSAGLLVTWLGTVGTGFALLWNYKMTPGPAEATPVVWPDESSIGRVRGTTTLVMFAHPLCPCSRASLTELEVLLRRAGPVDAHVSVLRPDDVGPEWDGGLLSAARAVPGVQVSQDKNGEEARRFGAHTSGHVVIYAADGRLLFSGGITGARGHIGDNVSLDKAVDAITGTKAAPASCPVFGCCLESRP